MNSILEHVRRPHAVAPEPSGAQTAVDAIYARLAPVYDLVYGVLLQPGRRTAMTRLAPRPGERILEVGVGTAITARRYPPGCRVVAIDVSEPMLRRVAARLARQRLGHVGLCRMDAMRLAFDEATFDAVYVPYLLNVVPDPLRAAREIARVCRPGGRVVFLNHFDRSQEEGPCDRWLGRLAGVVSGVNWHLNLKPLLVATGLVELSVEPVNVPRVSAVVVCRKP